jgi:perosamine synthetase
MKVAYSRPSIEQADIDAVTETLRSGWLSFGPEKDRFEQEFAAYVGVQHAVSLNSCTSALELALKAGEIRGEVVVPSLTWVATANAVMNAGAVPVFCDVEQTTRNMTANDVRRVLSPRTEALIVVHYGGQTCEMDDLVALCEARRLLMIEDCAETLGGTCGGRHAGCFGVGCFSFYPTKAITTGEGGMLTTNDAGLARRVRTLSSHGVPSAPASSGEVHRTWERAAVAHGHNYRMPSLLAALGRSQLKRLDELNDRRVALAHRYDRLFKTAEVRIQTPKVADQNRHVYQMYTVQLAREARNLVLEYLWDVGIAANVHFDPPVHRHPVFASRARADLPVTDRLAQELISLPIFPMMTKEEQDYVVEHVICAAQRYR